jgi:hypothetical protein
MFKTIIPLLLMTMKTLLPGEELIGEFHLPDVLLLEQRQLVTLRNLASQHPEARRIAEDQKRAAMPYLGAPATPLRVIQYEGLVNTNPKRIETVQSLQQMGHAALLVKYWQISGSPEAAETLKDWTTAWLSTYEITGNDVNENKLTPLLIASYYFLEDVPPAQRDEIVQSVQSLGEAHFEATLNSTHFTNRYSKHVRLTALCGKILENPKWLDAADHGVKLFVENSLYADGSSFDFHHRDTLTYHSSSLRPPLQLALLAGDRGEALYTWENSKGGSLKTSVDFVVPYAMGEKTREEWKNSKVDLDRRRAAAGLESYRTGRHYDPKNALELMELASAFDPELQEVVLHLTESKATRYPTFQTLLNATFQTMD